MPISFKEDHISQIPALLMLEKLGYTYLTPDEALALRGGNLANVLLEPVLRKQLAAINVVQVSSVRTTVFSEQNITAGIDALRNIPMDEGFMEASQTVYDLLTSGKTLEQIVDGDRKSFVMQYIDWKNPRNNVFHVTEEFAVSRTGMTETYRPDIVLFVNGIPLCVIECKRPDVKDSIEQAISQHLRNQKADGIRSLYLYSTLLLAINRQEGSYATTATPEKFWARWREQFTNREEEVRYRQELERVVNEPLLDDKLFGERFGYVRRNFEELYRQPVIPSVQDEYLYNLCRPERLLQLMYGFTLYDDGIKKVARYQQYFAVRQTMQRIRHIEGGRRRGGIRTPLTDPNIFVLIDEGHRSQYGEMGIKMEKTLPNACFIAMTGTPLMKKEKNTARKFGGIIQPVYTVDQAVADKAVVPLLYEGRMVPQVVHEETIDRYFDKICGWMSDAQRADMKKKFSHADQLNQTQQRIYAIAWDISQHFRENWQGSKFKAQLVAPRKRIAILYKQYLDEIGIVSSEVLITSPDTREGEDEAFGDTSNVEVAFWKRMMDEYGTAKKYEASIINRFKNSDKPEIIIVVDKLLTGFDEPRNTVLYLDRKLKDHTLLQAIARVNRVCEDKEFGYIIDYYGVLGSLNSALELYTDFDKEDLEGTYTDISEEVAKLPQKHAELWDLFKEVRNTTDFEAFGNVLREEDRRTLFYEKLRAFARTLKVALSSIVFHQNTPQEEVERYKHDLAFFMKLRNAVQERYSDTVDYKQYEGQIQKLIDTHIESGEVQVITDLVNIFDKERFAEEVEKISGKAAKADTIASRTAKYITENMDTDPAFYKKFSQMLKETISQYEQGRIDEAEYLTQATDLMNKVLNHTDSEIPDVLKDNNAARAYFGLSLEVYKSVIKPEQGLDLTQIALDTASRIDAIIRQHIFEKGTLIVDWPLKDRLVGMMKLDIEDYLIDEVKRKYDLSMTFDDMDAIIDRAVDVAQKWFR